MLRRPRATDTEEDLLVFQESFLASGGKPAVSVVSSSSSGTRAKAGDKRRQGSTQPEKDVVHMQTEDDGTLPGVGPPTKRSKFKERREKTKRKNEEGFEDPFEAMERHDRHITKLLTEIQEHDVLTMPPVTMPMRHTKHGFPIVHELDLSTLPARSTSQGDGTAAKKKSLFAQQFERFTPEYFGIELQPPLPTASTQQSQRDRVEPISFTRASGEGFQQTTSDLYKHDETGRTSVKEEKRMSDFGGKFASVREGDTREASPPVNLTVDSSDCKLRAESDPKTQVREEESLRKQYDSVASLTWDRFFQSSLVTGEGLGVSGETAHEEVIKIHDENVRRLSSLSEEEILQEKERIRQVLGPEVLSFLHSRKKKVGESVPVAVSPEGDVSRQKDEKGGEPEPMEPQGMGVSPSHGWLHMDVVEKEKMEWMTDVPLHPQSSEAVKEVRFSLEGLVIPQETIVPHHLGLHHHGNEPEAAGYTLNELLHLTRSTVLQQRVLSLQTLARILLKATQNEYHGLVEGSLLDSLLESGVPTLLRYTLDDTTDTVMAAAIQCIHGLLVSPVEEYLLDEYHDCYLGNKLPGLAAPHNHVEGNGEEPDMEIMQRDIIKGYLKMKLLYRLRYIVEVCRPPLPAVTDILEILARICRHSTQAASEVVNCPRLIKVIFVEFLPLSWNRDQDSSHAHGRPQSAAMKVVLAACTAGRNLAACLVGTHKLMDVVLRYALLHPTELDLPEPEAYGMSISSLRVWRMLLSYGLGSEAFRDTFPEVMKQLQLMSLTRLSSVGQSEARRVSALLMVVESAIHVAGVTREMLRVEGGGGLPPPALEWTHATGLLTPLLHTLTSWLGDAGRQKSDSTSCVSNLLHCVATYYSKLALKVPSCPLEVLQQIEALTSNILDEFVQSPLFTAALEAMRATSRLANSLPADVTSSRPSSLPAHLTLPSPPKLAHYKHPNMQFGDFQKLVQPEVISFTNGSLLLAYIRMCLAALSLHKGIANKVTGIFSNPVFRGYLESIIQSPVSKYSSFQFEELYLIYDTLKLFVTWVGLCDGSSPNEDLKQLFHHLAFKLLSLLPPGMEYCIHDVLSTVALHPALLFELESMETLVMRNIERLSLRDPTPLGTGDPTPLGTGNPTPLWTGDTMTTVALLTEALKRLGSVRSVYLTAVERSMCTKERLATSRNLLLQYPPAIKSCLLPTYSGSVLPLDWVLLPIVIEYNKTLRSDVTSPEPSGEVVSMVTHSLYLLLLLEHVRPNILREIPTAGKIARLMCLFLIGSDIFLEKEIRSCLASLLRLYCTEEMQNTLDFNAPIPGLASFHDLYTSLVSQYVAVSYGDQIFAGYVLLPLQQRFSVQHRRVLWNEYPNALRLISLPVAQVPFGINKFLHPVETDSILLELYMKVLAIGSISCRWSPLLYLIAVHHLNSFIFKDKEDPSSVTQLQRKLTQGVLQLKDDIKNHILFYAGLDGGKTELGFHTVTELTDFQRTRLSAVAGHMGTQLYH